MVVPLPLRTTSKRGTTVSLAVFQSIGPLELAIVLLIVLVIFGPKRLPGLGRSLGSGMREFKESITGKTDRDLEEDDDAREVNAALGRPEQASPLEGEVVSERERSRS
jgi:sec-independent protein translocase protein TatA